VTLSPASAAGWSGRLQVYEDVTGPNNAFNGGDDLIREEMSSGRSVTVADDQPAADSWISFNPQGWLNENASVWISICSADLPATSGNYIEINRVGKIREWRINNDVRGCL